MKWYGSLLENFLHFFFPHICSGCGSDRVPNNSSLCIKCLHSLPATHFASLPGNPVEKKFYGRLPLQSAFSLFYFAHESLIQRLMHAIKYHGDKELGFQLGCLMGQALQAATRFEPATLIPIPLHPAREKKRGYNQAQVLCEGIQSITGWPMETKAVKRIKFTDTQTKKKRIQRWMNIEGKFAVTDPALLKNKHLLLVDDVLTTGATLEACGEMILKVPHTRLSIATLCYAWH